MASDSEGELEICVEDIDGISSGSELEVCVEDIEEAGSCPQGEPPARQEVAPPPPPAPAPPAHRKPAEKSGARRRPPKKKSPAGGGKVCVLLISDIPLVVARLERIGKAFGAVEYRRGMLFMAEIAKPAFKDVMKSLQLEKIVLVDADLTMREPDQSGDYVYVPFSVTAFEGSRVKYEATYFLRPATGHEEGIVCGLHTCANVTSYLAHELRGLPTAILPICKQSAHGCAPHADCLVAACRQRKAGTRKEYVNSLGNK